MTRRYGIFIFMLIIVPSLIYAQSFEQLHQLYQQKKMDELGQLVRNNTSNSKEIVFFKTLFNESGEESIRIYESLFAGSSGELRSLVAKKISEYYYAKGFYVRAAEYNKYIQATTNPIITPTVVSSTKPYFIQVGAFSFRDNANRMKELLLEKKIESNVMVREINGKSLYCVWVNGSATYNETKIIADELKANYKLNYQIINP